MNAFENWKSTECLPNKDRIRKLYENQITKYEGEVKGFEIMIRREELSERHWQTKRDNINDLKTQLRKARYNLTRTKTLLADFDKPFVTDFQI